MLPMTGSLLRRRNQCTMDRCRGRDTLLYYRGREIGRNPMHLCSACVHDILEKFIEIEGAEKAYALLGELLERIQPAGEEPVAVVPAAVTEEAEETKAPRGRRKKGDTE